MMFVLDLSFYENLAACLVAFIFIVALLAFVDFIIHDDYERKDRWWLYAVAIITIFVLLIGGFISCNRKLDYIEKQFEEEFDECAKDIQIDDNEIVVETNDNIYVFTHIIGTNYEVEIKQK